MITDILIYRQYIQELQVIGMLYSKQAIEIGTQITKGSLIGPKLIQKLKEADEEFIEWQKSLLQQKLVPEIRNNYKVYNDFADKFRQKNVNFRDKKEAKFMFTNMMDVVDQKAYQYKKHDYQSIKKQLELTGNLLKAINKNNHSENNGEAHSGEWKLQENEGEQMIPGLQNIIQDKPPQKGFAPFLKSNENPYDRHANSKLLKGKYDHMTYNDRMRNVAGLVETNKQFTDIYQRNESFMKNEMKRAYSAFRNKNNNGSNKINHHQIFQNTMKTNQFGSALNVDDILKYTLGEKKERQKKVKAEPIKNPFVRVPMKYSQSLGDFYKIN